ncbi:ECF transporter S component [Metabacillus sp. HB246100]|uniref:ECF transporter S component n=1 Tax=Bacillus weihaiensis TaxID=1547283 RepID=UPI002352E941|nr:ECF transporter S component [Bacillus weihaiensis]
MGRSGIILFILFLCTTFLVIALPLFLGDYYLLSSFLFLLLTFVPFMIRFERRKVAGRELVLLAVMAAIAAVSRIPFASIPNVQPTTFVIIVAALAFGAESGFVIGALAALVSNLFLGQGPWTPWQMYAWGTIGLTAGLLRNTSFMKSMSGKVVFGFLSGILFGWVMNLWQIISLGDSITFEQVVAYYGLSFYFDLAHAFANIFFLLVFAKSWLKILERFRKKYGLLE